MLVDDIPKRRRPVTPRIGCGADRVCQPDTSDGPAGTATNQSGPKVPGGAPGAINQSMSGKARAPTETGAAIEGEANSRTRRRKPDASEPGTGTDPKAKVDPNQRVGPGEWGQIDPMKQ